jgi:transposase-like protein
MAMDAATAVSERRRCTTAHKLKIVSEILAPHASVTEVARRHGLNPNLIYRWRHQAKAGALSRAPEGQSRFALVAVAAGSGARTLTRGDLQGGCIRYHQETVKVVHCCCVNAHDSPHFKLARGCLRKAVARA